jgi:hypothetical protein
MYSPSSKPQKLAIDPLLLQTSEKIEASKENLDNTQIADDNAVKLDNSSSPSSSEASEILVKKK